MLENSDDLLTGSSLEGRSRWTSAQAGPCHPPFAFSFVQTTNWTRLRVPLRL
jgi:hypothetical protein